MIESTYCFFVTPPYRTWDLGGPAGWRTVLQIGMLRARFPMVSFEFFIDNPSGRTRVPGFDSASNSNECQEYFLGVEAAGA